MKRLRAVYPLLIETKLRPPVLKASLVDRLSLLRKLDAAIDRKITVISAPAGFGKSTLLAQWVQSAGVRGVAIGWLSLDAQDDDLNRVLDYLIAAISRADPATAADIPVLLRSSPVLPVDSVLTALVNGLCVRSQHMFLILDDCHHLAAPEIAQFLDAFLTYAPPILHVILATRGQVPLKVANMRVKGQMLRLDDSDLRFSLEETESFLNGMQALDIDPADVVFLQHRTEGWIAGLQLASLSLDKRSEPQAFIRRFSGTDHDIAEFLVHDVVERLSPTIIDFLLRTSILGRFSAPLADAVTGSSNAEQMLGLIEAANLFLIALDRDHTWFRYHQMFSELLRSLLVKRHVHEVPALHRRAANWLSGNGLTIDAVQHALAAGDLELAASLVESCCMPLIRQSQIIQVHGWLKALPSEVIKTRPRLQLVQAWILLHMSGSRPPTSALRSNRQ